MYYHKLGKFPQKRHTQFRRPDGELYTEHLFGAEGFSGNSSIMYHHTEPTQVLRVELGADVKPVAVSDDVLRHHHLVTKDIDEGGDAITSRKTVLFNNDVEIMLSRPTENMNYFYKNGEHDEMFFVHEGEGYVQTMFGRLEFKPFDYVYIPRATIYQVVFHTKKNRLLVWDSTGPIEFPKRYLSDMGQFMENSPFCERDFRLPTEPLYFEEQGEFEIRIKKLGRLHHYWMNHHPFNVIGWDGYLYPWIFSMKDFEPITGRVHQPPPVHQTFNAHNYVVCSFVPRKYDYHPLAIPAPYAHSNVDSDEVLYYVEGDFMSRKGVHYASITHHPGGIPHGPHPGTVKKSIGKEATNEWAVMIDTFKPLFRTKYAVDLDDPKYPHSWVE
ncbi:homogentisate 1,2-dioxygenase [bacterium]|nr:MAG: homogentisate 1,2-dioxygenase [bacterium]